MAVFPCTSSNCASWDCPCSAGQDGRRLLLRWLQAQGGGARQALAAVRTALRDAKTAARKRQLANHAAKV